MKICSLNARGLGNLKKRRDVFHYLRGHNFDIICLQDTHFTAKQEAHIQCEWGYKCLFSSYSSAARGTAILFKNSFEHEIHSTSRDINGNFIIVDLTIENHKMTLVNLYGPNNDEPWFYTNLQNKIKQLNNQNIIMVGDWNLLLDPNIDGKNYRHINNPRAKEEVLKIMNDLNLCDVWREENPDKARFTWRRSMQNKDTQMGRLDFFLVSDPLLTWTVNQNIEIGYRSDHSVITLEIKLNDTQKRKTFWKFNNSLLHSEEYAKEVRRTILEVKKQYAASPYNPDKLNDIPNEQFEATINPTLFLEILLMEIRKTTIAKAAELKKDKKGSRT